MAREYKTVFAYGYSGDKTFPPVRVPTGRRLDAVHVISDTVTDTSDVSNLWTFQLLDSSGNVMASYPTFASGAAQDLDVNTAKALTLVEAYRDVDAGDVLIAKMDETGSATDMSAAFITFELTFK